MLKDRVVTLSHWFAKQQASNFPTPLMDLRTGKRVNRLSSGKLNMTLVPFSIDFLKERSFELPARHVEFAILLAPSDLDKAEAFLLGSKDNSRKRPQKPWQVSDVLLETPNFWEEAKALKIYQEKTDRQDDEIFPLPRLWQPDAMVQNSLLPLLRESLSSDDEVWDLASGAGRDVAFLAEELVSSKTSFKSVVGFDHRYNEKETNIVKGFLDRRGVAEKTSVVKMDLSSFGLVEEAMEFKSVAALLVVRFWKPLLVEALAKSDCLASGTLFAISHFCKPFDGAPWDFVHPSEKTVLERNQLHNLFHQDWDILHDEIASDSDHGRSMIHFIAKRR